MISHFQILRWLNQPWVIKLARALRAREGVDYVLGQFPFPYVLSSGIKIPITSLEGLLLAREIFSIEMYACLKPYIGKITHLLDVGSNRGYFPIYLSHLRQGQGLSPSDLQGLAIDANPKLVELSRSLMASAQVSKVEVICGLVGMGNESMGSFYVHASDGLSSRFIEGTEIQVPCVKIEQEWRGRFPDHLPDVIKIDIEGSEWDLLQTEGAFIRQVNLVIIECHSPQAPFSKVTEMMKGLGFAMAGVISGSDTVHCALYTQSPLVANSLVMPN